MNEPMDDILRVLKRKQRYSLDSINSSSEERYDSNNKLKAKKKANRGIPKVALKTQRKKQISRENSDDSECEEIKKHTNMVVYDYITRDARYIVLLGRQEKFSAFPVAKNYLTAKKKTQIIKKDEKEKRLQPMHEIRRLAKPIHSIENQMESSEVDEDSDYKTENSDEADDISDYNPESSDESSDVSISDTKTENSDEADDISDYNPESSDESSDVSITDDEVLYDSRTSDESYHSDKKENSFISVKNKRKVKRKEKVNNVKSAGVMSSYEKMVEERKREAMEFLKSLKINDIKADLNALVENKKGPSEKAVKEKKQTDLQSYNFVTKKAKANLKTKKYTQGIKSDEIRFEPIRKSRRVAMQTENIENQPVCENTRSFKDTFAMEDNIYEEYIDNVCIKIPEQTKSLFYSKSTFERLNLDPSNEFCFKGNNFTSLTWHSSTRPLILVAGNKQGYIAVMNIETDAYFFKPHKNLVSHVQFNHFNPAQMFSTSLDGKLLCGDMVKHTFNEVYKYDVALNYFEILSPTTCLVAQKNGKVAIVDNRSYRKRATQLTCHTNSIETVNLHPTNQNYFVTAENKGSIHLWDLRRIQEHPVAAVNFEKTLHSAFFSPVTGNSILATTDCEVSCFDNTHLTGNLNILHKEKFGNFHSCRARASWVPNSDKLFVVGSMDKNNNKIAVYDKNMELYHLLMKRESNSNCTFMNAFHPCIPAFAAASTLGTHKGHILVYM